MGFAHVIKLDYQHRCTELLDELRKEAKTATDPTANDSEGEDTQHGTKSIGRYKNARHFRDGLHSDVYKTTAPNDNPDGFTGNAGAAVALKVTYLIGMAPPHNSEREVRVLRKVVHQSIIALWESFREPRYSHLVLVFPFMPYDLNMILRQGYIAEATGRGYLRDIFQALEHVHSLGIIHRDIKPSNILMKSPSGPAYLADFGTVWDPEDPASEPAHEKITDVGTTSYRAPDVLFGRTSYDHSLDMWAAGCLVAQVATSSYEPLFDSGDVGSDLTLIQSIFKKLGTPTSKTWPVSANTRFVRCSSLISCRMQRTVLTGARYSGLNTQQKLGQSCYQMLRTSQGTWFPNWLSTKAVNE
jgi:serine/threonine protein kinase